MYLPQEPGFTGEDEDHISEEEIRAFKANQTTLNTKRQELREKLKQQFAKRFCTASGTDHEAITEDMQKMSVN